MPIELFEQAVANGEFIEYARVHANMYGTTYAGVNKVCKYLFYISDHVFYLSSFFICLGAQRGQGLHSGY